jgi:hypothetical protein
MMIAMSNILRAVPFRLARNGNRYESIELCSLHIQVSVMALLRPENDHATFAPDFSYTASNASSS